MISINSRQTTLNHVRATINYVQNNGEQLYSYFHVEPPAGRLTANDVAEAHTVPIADLRQMPGGADLETHGFELVDFETAAQDIYDFSQRESIYFKEAADLVKRKTGAAEVRVFDAFMRGEEAQRRIPGTISTFADRVHVDFTKTTGPVYFNRLLQQDAERLKGRRFAIINVWKPITGPLTDHPLAVCDARTVSDNDLIITTTFTRVDKNGLHSSDGEISESDIYSVSFSDKHCWYYAPAMTTREALLLKNYDSAEHGVSRFTPHVAFVDPSAPEDGLPRASIELRVLTVW